MSSIQSKQTRHAKKQENMTHDEKNQIIRTALQLTYLVALTEKELKSLLKTILPVFNKQEQRLNISKCAEDI